MTSMPYAYHVVAVSRRIVLPWWCASGAWFFVISCTLRWGPGFRLGLGLGTVHLGSSAASAVSSSTCMALTVSASLSRHSLCICDKTAAGLLACIEASL